jgi:hypothetical protein
MSYAVGRATQILLIDTAILIALLVGYRYVLTGKTLLLWTHFEIKLTFVEMLLIRTNVIQCKRVEDGLADLETHTNSTSTFTGIHQVVSCMSTMLVRSSHACYASDSYSWATQP